MGRTLVEELILRCAPSFVLEVVVILACLEGHVRGLADVAVLVDEAWGLDGDDIGLK